MCVWLVYLFGQPCCVLFAVAVAGKQPLPGSHTSCCHISAHTLTHSVYTLHCPHTSPGFSPLSGLTKVTSLDMMMIKLHGMLGLNFQFTGLMMIFSGKSDCLWFMQLGAVLQEWQTTFTSCRHEGICLSQHHPRLNSNSNVTVTFTVPLTRQFSINCKEH